MCCPYCRDENRQHLINYEGFTVGIDEVYDYDRFLVVEANIKIGSTNYFPVTSGMIYYCPMCGRDLRGGDND